VRAVHNDWYRELFQPSVTAGLLEAGALAGLPNIPVFLRGSRYVPPRWEAVRDAMPAFFKTFWKKRPEPAVRAVLGHWLFGYIHPYPDGNGRMARFLMNVMLASGGYPWTVIRIRDRKSYLGAWTRASIEMDIHPFAHFIDHRVQWRLARHDLSFPAPMEVRFRPRPCPFLRTRWRGGSCGASSAGKPWTSTFRVAARTNSRYPSDPPGHRAGGTAGICCWRH